MKNNHWTGCGVIHSKKTILIKDARTDYYVTDLVIIIKRLIKGVEKQTFVPCECWGLMSQEAEKLNEGDFVCVEGHFENKKWFNKDRVEMRKNIIALEKIELKD